MNQPTTAAAPPPRPIPAIPGGGSWRFDEARWQWVANEASAAPSTPAAEPAAPIAAPAGKQPSTEE
jgi:hypothetical protein